MAKIWGLDLHDIQWSKFKSSYMFGNKDYHMRRTKFIIYQCAMIFLVVSESLGTAVLSDYLDQQSELQGEFDHINVFNNDFIGIASYNIFIGVFAAIVFGAAFFFDLFFPDRYEPRWVQFLWMGGAIFCCVGGLADALAYTVILSVRGLRISNVDRNNPELVAALRSSNGKTPVLYKHSGRAVASVIFLWVGWVCAIGSTVVMCRFYSYYRQHGTAKSSHLRAKDEYTTGQGSIAQHEKTGITETSPDRTATSTNEDNRRPIHLIVNGERVEQA